MGKSDTGNKSLRQSKVFRRSLFSSSTMAVFLQSTRADQISSTAFSVDNKSRDNFSAINLFGLLKEANKVIVKGGKLFESLNELRLCGWINPFTLLLSGPSEDMKVLKHAWVKRHLKSPRGYFIRDIGIIKDCVVDLVVQSPYMSLTTALFDAVADLNHQNIFPTKDTLYDYLRKRYPDIQTPETKIIHQCLGRLIKNRRLYHNGRGYFVLMHENLLNEIISMKSSRRYGDSDCSSYEPSVLGFSMNESIASSSCATDAFTDNDFKSTPYPQNNGSKTSKPIVRSEMDALTELSTDVTNQDTSSSTAKSLSSRLFRRNNSKSDKQQKKSDHPKQKSTAAKILSCGLGGTPTDSIILSNGILDSPIKLSPFDKPNEVKDITCMIKNRDVLDSTLSDDTLLATDEKQHSSINPRRRFKRSRSISGKGDRSKSQKEVSFALIGSPNQEDTNSDPEGGEVINYFKQRSYSFGMGYSRDIYQRPQVATIRTISKTPTNVDGHHINTPDNFDEQSINMLDDFDERSINSPDNCDGNSIKNSLNAVAHHENSTETLDELSGQYIETPDGINQHSTIQDNSFNFEDYENYHDVKSSFVDDSIPLRGTAEIEHRPDSLPLKNGPSMDMIHNYQDLGSALSLPTLDNSNQFKVTDLLSPTKEECLAEELKLAYEDSAAPHTNGIGIKEELECIDINLLSPRSRGTLCTPDGSMYLVEALKESEEICKALEDSKNGDSTNSHHSLKIKDKNSNYIMNGNARHSKLGKHTKKHSPKDGKTNSHDVPKTYETPSNHTTKDVNSKYYEAPKKHNSESVTHRGRKKSNDDRKLKQKERNSQLFEEKRPTLKVMGMV